MFRYLATVFLLGPIIYGCPPPLEERMDLKGLKEEINYRLPTHINPHRYYITLEPNLKPNINPANFTGAVTIELSPTVDNSNNITLHTRQLNLTKETIEIIHSSGKKIPITDIVRDDVREFYTFYTDEHLIRNEIYNLSIPHYEGTLNLENAGFYLAKYYDKQGRERRFATTQFQSTSARRAYPCLDEPHMKASFVVNLIRPQNLTSISNEDPLHTEQLGNGRVLDAYKESVVMSTYLTAFVVSDYKHTNRTENQRVFADEDSVAEGNAEFALQVGIEILNSLQEYLQVNYSLEKMDQIAIPDDYFAPGAMENWGLVTYRKSYIVYPNATATTSQHQRTIQIVAHEFAHQWFGNLVTCDWWKYIWLNEGFANYFESFAAALIRPDWGFDQQFLLTSVHSALVSDSTNLTKPMNYGGNYAGGPPSYVAYQKAGAVIRMMEHFLTNQVFKKGLTIHLNNNAFRSVKPSDLYMALQQAVDAENKGYLLENRSVASIIRTWDSQAGYPIVRVIRDYQIGDVTLHQERFFNRDYNISDNSTWYIPINFLTPNSSRDTTAEFWLTERRAIPNYAVANDDWLILNKQQTGYYRVNYDDTNWKLITEHLKNKDLDRIHVLNRAQLIDDAFIFADSGILSYQVALDLSAYLPRETEWTVIAVFDKVLYLLDKMLAATPEYNLFQNYVIDSFSGAYKKLGFHEGPLDKNLNRLARPIILSWLGKVGHKEIREKSLNWLRELNSTSYVTPNLQTSVYCGAMRIGNSNDWESLYEKYENAGNSTQRPRILNGLACSENKDILNRLLSKVEDNNSSLRVSDRYSTFRNVINAGNVGLNTAFDYIDEHLESLKTKINIPSILQEIGSRFTTKEQLDKLVELGKKHSLSASVVDNATKGTKQNIEWSAKYIDDIKKWLKAYSISKVELSRVNCI